VPYLTSGLLAFKKPNAKLVLELTEETTGRALTKWLSRYVPVKGEPKQPAADRSTRSRTLPCWRR